MISHIQFLYSSSDLPHWLWFHSHREEDETSALKINPLWLMAALSLVPSHHTHIWTQFQNLFSPTLSFLRPGLFGPLSLSMHKHTSPYLPPVGVRRSAIIVFFNHPHKLQMNLYQFDFPTFLQLFLHAFRWTSRGSASSLTLLELPRGLCQQGFNELKCRALTQADR